MWSMTVIIIGETLGVVSQNIVKIKYPFRLISIFYKFLGIANKNYWFTQYNYIAVDNELH
jgi:hypothetical protein